MRSSSFFFLGAIPAAWRCTEFQQGIVDSGVFLYSPAGYPGGHQRTLQGGSRIVFITTRKCVRVTGTEETRQCATNLYLRKKDDPHRYCQGACAENTYCGPIVVPKEHLQQCMVCADNGKYWGPRGQPDGVGILDADFVLYVSGITTERCGQENIVAYAAYCQLEGTLDRPVAGYANLCPNMISTQTQEFIGMLSTVKHEIIHALGFSAGLFAFYHSNDGKPLTRRNANGLPPFNESLGLYQWSDKVVRSATRLWDVSGNKRLRHDVYLLVTPHVVEEARKHFACPILEGMELENQGGMGTELNHWEKRLLEYFDSIPGVAAQDLPYYGGSVEIADYCPFTQEFSWHLSGAFQRTSDCRIVENQPARKTMTKEERINIDQVVVPHCVVWMSGDSSCLFSSLAYLVHGTTSLAAQIRVDIVSQVSNNWWIT
ncbi:LMLN peptidase, partial [Polypterus senegalus]